MTPRLRAPGGDGLDAGVVSRRLGGRRRSTSFHWRRWRSPAGIVPGGLHLIPTQRNAKVMQEGITWNYTTWLNIAFLILAGLLVWRFFNTGGLAMLRIMNKPSAMGHSHQHM